MSEALKRLAGNDEQTRLAWGYERRDDGSRRTDSEKADYIQSRNFQELTEKERVRVIKWLRAVVPVVVPTLLNGDAAKIFAKAALSSAVSRRLEQMASCRITEKDTDNCPKSYRVYCSYTDVNGRKKYLTPYNKYMNCSE